MRKVLFLASAVVALFAVQPAHADDWRSGLYIKGGVGLAYSRDQEYADGVNRRETELKNGYSVQGAVGYDYGMFRSELELSYRRNDVDGHTRNGVTLGNPGGDSESFAGMINGYVDIPTGTVVTPYVGAGVGFARVDANEYDTSGVDFLDDGETDFAYQGIAGLDFAIDDALSLYTEYKYFAVDNSEVRTVANNPSDLDYDSHSVSVGLRYSFQ
ncbi:MAG: porin family protein [Proteobacteria bacterium]|nr:porin family protein [Pseudomonadota bacterium]